MRSSLIIFCFCFLVVAVHSATTTKRGTSKAPARRSAYAYLRTVRRTKSCASGKCPFWEKHGRSFVSLRCYSEQYQECVCLHRMCYSSCVFDRNTCNEEMVSCLQQICRRCLPAASAKTMCPAYDAMVERAVQSLTNFACYPCCANGPNSNRNSTSSNVVGMTVTTPIMNGPARPGNNAVAGAVPSTNGPQNGGRISSTNRPNGAVTGLVNGGARPANAGTGSVNGGARPANAGTGSVNGGARPANAGTNSVNGGARPANAVTGSVNGGARPANAGANSVNGGARPANAVTGSVNGGARPPNAGNTNRPSNGNQGNVNAPSAASVSNNGQANGASVNQRVKKPARTTRRIVTTIKRRSATARTTMRKN